jgi:hypothetical protein
VAGNKRPTMPVLAWVPADRYLTGDERRTRRYCRSGLYRRALQRLRNEVASLRDQMTVLIATVLRHERMLDGILEGCGTSGGKFPLWSPRTRASWIPGLSLASIELTTDGSLTLSPGDHRKDEERADIFEECRGRPARRCRARCG